MTLKIIHRYFLRELLKVFCLVLFCLFGLYVLIDYTSRASSLGLDFSQLSQYYFFTFVHRLDVLVPFALLIAGIKTVCQANLRQELVAMQAAGAPMRQVLAPLLWIGLAATAGVYLSTQLLVPYSIQWIHRMEDQYSLKKGAHERHLVNRVVLSDGSRFLYLTYDHAREVFLNCYWVRSLDDIYRMRSLAPKGTPTGLQVDHFSRDVQGNLIPDGFLPELSFDQMHFREEELTDTVTTPSERSLAQLWQRLAVSTDSATYEKAQIEAAFYKKLVMPWLCLIALLGPAPFCAVHRRPLRVLFLFAGSILGLFAFFVLLNMGHTLAQSQLMNPLLALVVPIAICTISLVKRWSSGI